MFKTCLKLVSTLILKENKQLQNENKRLKEEVKDLEEHCKDIDRSWGIKGSYWIDERMTRKELSMHNCYTNRWLVHRYSKNLTTLFRLNTLWTHSYQTNISGLKRQQIFDDGVYDIILPNMTIDITVVVWFIPLLNSRSTEITIYTYSIPATANGMATVDLEKGLIHEYS